MAEVIHRAVRRGLAHAAPLIGERRIDVRLDLAATHRLRTAHPALEAALETIFRALPARVAPGSTLRIETADRAGGDVEVVWEVVEPPAAAEIDDPVERLASGPAGDLLALAVEGLERICRARGVARRLREAEGWIVGRYAFLVPSLERTP